MKQKTREEFKRDNDELRKLNRKLTRENLDLQEQNDAVENLKEAYNRLMLENKNILENAHKLEAKLVELEDINDDLLSKDEVQDELESFTIDIDTLIEGLQNRLYK
jgi:chromosome segregation ATPase